MLKLSESQQVQLKEAVEHARGKAGVAQRIAEIYDRFDVEFQTRRPRCDQSGKCCHFEEYGHRLFVTTAELASFVLANTRDEAIVWDGLGCPYQIDGLCSVHSSRPFGCRVYFCDTSSTQWQQTMYERFHAEIKQLHDELGLDYMYVEWREGLRAIGLAKTISPTANRLNIISIR